MKFTWKAPSTHIALVNGALAIALVFPIWGQAGESLSLAEAIKAAQIHDKEYLASQTLGDTADALRSQANSLWRPQIMATAVIAKSNHETRVAGAQFSAVAFGANPITGANFNTEINRGNAFEWAVSAKQPLFNLARNAQSAQLKVAASMVDLQKISAQQAMIVRISERYFDAQLAQQKLQLLSAQLVATQKMTEEAKYRYDIGNRPITEVYEAQAQLARIQSEHYGAQSDVQLKLQRLQDAIGHVPSALPNSITLKNSLPKLDDVAIWLDKARSNNVELKRQNLAVQNAQAQANEYALGASTSLDLVGQIGRKKLTGSGDYGSASNRENTSMVGVQLTVPLYTGGYNSAKHKEAQAAMKKAQLDLATAQERVAQQVNDAWLGTQTAQRQITALTRALKASEAQLDATQTGQEVGHRTLLDVLNAQNQTTYTRIQLESAKQNYLLSYLRLAVLVAEGDDKTVTQLLAK